MSKSNSCGISRGHARQPPRSPSMVKQIAIVDGHPDPDSSRFCHAIARAYAEAAEGAGHHVKRFEIAQLEFPVLRTRSEWESGELVLPIRECQQAIGSAQHIVLIYPLWLGDVPAPL